MSAFPSFASRLREAREAKRWSQRRLAETVGKSELTIANYEKGATTPDLSTLQALAEQLGRTIDWLLGLKIPVERGGYYQEGGPEGAKDYPRLTTPRYTPPPAFLDAPISRSLREEVVTQFSSHMDAEEVSAFVNVLSREFPSFKSRSKEYTAKICAEVGLEMVYSEEATAPARLDHKRSRVVVRPQPETAEGKGVLREAVTTELIKFCLFQDPPEESVTWLDEHGRMAVWTRGGFKMYGYTPIEAQGQPLHFFCPHSPVHEILKRKRKSDLVNTVTEDLCPMKRKDGSIFLSWSVFTPIGDADRADRKIPEQYHFEVRVIDLSMDIIAKRIAREVLVPASIFRRKLRQLGASLTAHAAYFQVTHACVLQRMLDLGLLGLAMREGGVWVMEREARNERDGTSGAPRASAPDGA